MSLSDFVPSPERSLPIVILADVSGSMTQHGKLAAQSQAIGEMVDAFRADATTRGAVLLGVVAFGGETAELALPLRSVAELTWDPTTLVAGGKTPWGAAIAYARDVIAAVPEPTFEPTIVMTSDGLPTDPWEPQLEQLLQTRRGARSHRFAIAIGEDADVTALARFTGDPARVLPAGDASDIVEYFRRITLSVTQALARGTYESGLAPPRDDF